MMYRRSRSGRWGSILIAMVVGIVAGLGYWYFDSRPALEPAATPEISVITPAAILPTVPPPEPTAVVNRQREITSGAHFRAPTAGISGEIIQSYISGSSWDVTDLGRFVGHLQGTAWLDMGSNIVLAGHVEMTDGRQGIFANIDELQIGDPVYLAQDGEERTYQVTQLYSTEPTDLSVLTPTNAERVTLITCSNYNFFEDTYLDRVVVIAERIT